MFMIISMSLTLNLCMLTILMKHPISLGTILFIQTILISNMCILISKSSWFSFIMFITIIGGMMIMFLYMASIASNEKFKLSINGLIIFTATTMMTLLILILSKETWKQHEMTQTILNNSNDQIKSMLKLYSSTKKFTLLTLVILLFMLIIKVSFMCFSFKGPLKMK